MSNNSPFLSPAKRKLKKYGLNQNQFHLQKKEEEIKTSKNLITH